MEFKKMTIKLELVFRALAKAYADAERDEVTSLSMGCLLWL